MASSLLECFNCGKLFRRSESLAANTHELYASTYCSLVCQDKDIEDMNEAIKQAQFEEEQAKIKDLDTDTTSTELSTQVKDINVAGFNLKVRMPK